MWLVKAERGRKIAETANSTPLRHVKCGIYNEYVVFVPDAAKKKFISRLRHISAAFFY
jgi:hypothetical protein